MMDSVLTVGAITLALAGGVVVIEVCYVRWRKHRLGRR